MARTIQKVVRTFRELVEAQKQGVVTEKAVSRVRQWLLESSSEFAIEAEVGFWQDLLASIGFEDAEINYSLGYCQGDGASFTCKNINMEVLLSFLAKDVQPNEVSCENPHGYLVSRLLDGKPKPGDSRFDWLLLFTDYFGGNVTRTNHHYVHENTVDAEIEYLNNTSRTRFVDAESLRLQKVVRKLVRDLCLLIKHDLYEAAEIPDEMLMDDCEANGWHFDEQGRFEPTEQPSQV